MKIYIELSNVDWALLRRQKRLLGRLALRSNDQKKREVFEGLLNLLDNIQDQAAKSLGELAVSEKSANERPRQSSTISK